MISTGACSCAVGRDGSAKGCSSVDVVDTAAGPRFVESACSKVDSAIARRDAENERASRAGVPEGAMTNNCVITRDEYGTLTRRWL